MEEDLMEDVGVMQEKPQGDGSVPGDEIGWQFPAFRCLEEVGNGIAQLDRRFQKYEDSRTPCFPVECIPYWVNGVRAAAP